MKAAITSSPLPEQAEINLRIEVKSRFNITSLVACQNVNLFLLFNLGNLVTAGEPILLIGEKLRWRVPVIYSLPGKGQLGQVGELAVNVETGEIIMEESQPSSLEEMDRHVEYLYSSASDSSS